MSVWTVQLQVSSSYTTQVKILTCFRKTSFFDQYTLSNAAEMLSNYYRMCRHFQFQGQGVKFPMRNSNINVSSCSKSDKKSSPFERAPFGLELTFCKPRLISLLELNRSGNMMLSCLQCMCIVTSRCQHLLNLHTNTLILGLMEKLTHSLAGLTWSTKCFEKMCLVQETTYSVSDSVSCCFSHVLKSPPKGTRARADTLATSSAKETSFCATFLGSTGLDLRTPPVPIIGFCCSSERAVARGTDLMSKADSVGPWM